MDLIEIKGLDLEIDPNIQEVCEISNSSSGSTRSILYVLVLVNILILIALLNTHKWNWTGYRVRKLQTELEDLRKMKIKDTTSEEYIRHDVEIRVKENFLFSIARSDIENYHTVRVPILGNAFDINNLGIVTGITFLILFIICRFTLAREINNLRIALNAISDRYIDNSDRNKFKDALGDKEFLKRVKGNDDVILSSINYTRRQHHYNYLTMNEIFNFPPLETSRNKVVHKIIGRVVMKMFYLPVIVCCLVITNDIATFRFASRLSQTYGLVSLFISAISIIVVYLLAKRCTKQKDYIFGLYSQFKNDSYNWNSSMLDQNAVVKEFGHRGLQIRKGR
jgi:hypothetical protein